MVRATAKRATGDLPGIDARERERERTKLGAAKSLQRAARWIRNSAASGPGGSSPAYFASCGRWFDSADGGNCSARKLVIYLVYRLFSSHGAAFELTSGGGGEREIDGDASIPDY